MAAKEKRFQWNKGNKIENLIRCLAISKLKWNTTVNNSDFNADMVKQYEAVREAIAWIYEDEPTFFGPSVITPSPAPSDQIDHEKMAEIQQRQKITKAILHEKYFYFSVTLCTQFAQAYILSPG